MAGPPFLVQARQIWSDRRVRLSPLRITTLVPLAKPLFDAGDIAHDARPLNEMIHRK